MVETARSGLSTPAALVAGALDFLPRAWDPARALHSFSATLRPDGTLEQDWSHPQTARYTINSLLGLQAADADAAAPLIDAFAAAHADALRSPADVGLFALLQRDASALARVRDVARAPSTGLNMQDLAWMLWGASACPGGEDVARSLLDRILAERVHPRTGLPLHSVRLYRRGVVSFGSLVYFLRALHEAERVLDDPRAGLLFRRGVETALALQGPQGEWPWMIDVARGRAFDRYPVFSVHQDSMAMLFLLPARGRPGIDAAIERSLRWVHGENELALRMYVEEPFFFAFRAIERDEHAARARRYLRWAARRDAGAAPRLRVNRECRSYHLGWILYAWAPLL